MVPLARPAESRWLRKVRKEADRADIVRSLRLPNIFPTFCRSLRLSRLIQSCVVRFYPIPSSGKTHRATSASRLSTVSSLKNSFPSVNSFKHRSSMEHVNQRVVFDNTFHRRKFLFERRSAHLMLFTWNQF